MMFTVAEVSDPTWANPEHTLLDVQVLFEEFADTKGAVPFTMSANDPTEYGQTIWAAAMAGDYGEIAEYVAPDPVAETIPDEISRRQFFQQLAVDEIITKAEALAALQSGTIPSALQAIIDALPSEDDQFSATMLIIGATSFSKSHDLVETVRVAFGWTEEQRDTFWLAASKL